MYQNHQMHVIYIIYIYHKIACEISISRHNNIYAKQMIDIQHDIEIQMESLARTTDFLALSRGLKRKVRHANGTTLY